MGSLEIHDSHRSLATQYGILATHRRGLIERKSWRLRRLFGAKRKWPASDQTAANDPKRATPLMLTPRVRRLAAWLRTCVHGLKPASRLPSAPPRACHGW